MDYEYIRFLMLYSDEKFPFEKAKADPGMTEGLRSVRKYLQNNSVRRENASDLNRMLLLEKQMKHRMQLEDKMKRLADEIKNLPPIDKRDKE